MSNKIEVSEKEARILHETQHIIQHIKPLLMLENWDILVYRGDQKEMDAQAGSSQVIDQSMASMATAHPDYKYQRLYIRLGDVYFGDDIDDMARQECILHEMCHVFTQPITEIIEWQEQNKEKNVPISILHINFVNEMVTEHIAKCFKAILNERAGRADKKKRAKKKAAQ